MEEGTQTTNVFRTAKNQRNSSGSAFSTTNHPRICHQPWKLDAKQLRNIWCIPEAQLMSSVIFQSDIITKHYLTLKGLPIPSFTRSRKASSLSELSWYFPCIEKVDSMNNQKHQTLNTLHYTASPLLFCFSSPWSQSLDHLNHLSSSLLQEEISMVWRGEKPRVFANLC